MVVTVDKGDALFIAPGTVHETRNPDGEEENTTSSNGKNAKSASTSTSTATNSNSKNTLNSCGVSVTFQL